MRALILVVITAAALGLHPAFGQDTAESLAHAMDLVQQASGDAGNKPDDAERIRLLTQALQITKTVPMHNLKGHRVLAIEDLRVAIQLIRDGDPKAQLSGYIHNAISELKAAIASAEVIAVAQLPVPPQAAVPAPALPAPSEPATNAAAPALAPDNALPPGVTAEMEKDFLARYEAVIASAKASKGEKDSSALTSYYALFAMDPTVPPDGKEAFEKLSLFGIALDASGDNPTYAFVPVPPDDKSNAASLTLAGKVYTGYLPPVVKLKTTFAPPEHPNPGGMTPSGSSHPLCVENGKLMFIGIKLVANAVPPPIDNPAGNFGLTPNHLKEADTDKDEAFASLDKFLAALKHPSVQVLESGQNEFVYYAICRVKPDLLVFVEGNRPGMDNYSETFEVTDAKHAQLEKFKNQITLAEDPPSLDGGANPVLQGDVYHPNAGYTGPINIFAQYGKESVSNDPTQGVFKTVDWK